MLKRTGKILRVGYNLLAMGLNKLLFCAHYNESDSTKWTYNFTKRLECASLAAWFLTLPHVTMTNCHYVIADNIPQFTCLSAPRDCSEVFNSGERSDGVYTVCVGTTRRPVDVYCDMTTEGGGWTVCVKMCCNSKLLLLRMREKVYVIDVISAFNLDVVLWNKKYVLWNVYLPNACCFPPHYPN